MRCRWPLWTIAVFLGVLAPAYAADPRVTETEPIELGLVETTGRRLVQLDVSVRGPAASLTGLTAEEFEIVVGGRSIDEFSVDAGCGERWPVWMAGTGMRGHILSPCRRTTPARARGAQRFFRPSVYQGPRHEKGCLRVRSVRRDLRGSAG